MKNYLNKIQELELLSSLESRAESPLKFVYIGNGYENWIKVAEKGMKEGNLEFEEEALKKESLPFIFKKIKRNDNINIIDLGCGNGIPMISIFTYLKNISSNITYRPIDISQTMLDSATEKIKQGFPFIKIDPILFDFENGEIIEKLLQLPREKNTHNFFLFLGNTIGNFDNTEKILSNLKMSMFSDDHLIIGNQISNFLNTQKLLNYYSGQEIFDLLTFTLKNYGLKCEIEEFYTKWNNEKKQVEGFLSLSSDKSIIIGNNTLKFEKGEEILLFISKKYVEESIIETLNKTGFRIDLFTTNKRKNHCIASVSPTRYRS